MGLISEDIAQLKSRNASVEMDKAWEISKTRRIFIALITYIVAAYYMRTLGVADYYLHALVPTGGYALSTLTLPMLKRWWIKKNP
ncbi:MAG: hypothetical protein COB76_04325 [Alphaproteobacteria bacterium]|nr:MAG: hypothetical protein COB76_04325 [Alphaproteobacteria bacterium]